MKKFVIVILMMVIMSATITAHAELSFWDFLENTEVGEVNEMPDGTYEMVMKTINEYEVIVTATDPDPDAADITVVKADGEVINVGTIHHDDYEEQMTIVFTWIYEDYVRGL